MLRIEQILADYQFQEFLLDEFKPSHARACLKPLIANIRKAEGDPAQIEGVRRATKELDWNVAADLLNAGCILTVVTGTDLPSLRKASEELLESYQGEASPRRPTVKARREAVRDLVRCFEIHSPLDPDRDDQEIIPQEYLDEMCKFVEFALRSAGIAAPASGDAKSGEQYQGRLRWEIKKFL